MGTIKTTNIQSISGSGTVTLGVSGETFDIPSGVTLDSTGATITGALTNTPSFAAYASGDQALTDNAWTKLQFDTEIYDVGGGYDNVNDKFVVPAGEAGKYSFSARCNIDTAHNTAGASDIHIGIYVNGTIYSNQQQRWLGYPQRNVGVNLTQILNLSVSDYVEIYNNCDDGQNSPNAESSDKHIYFEGFKLIGA